jgi:hypothetical protein
MGTARYGDLVPQHERLGAFGRSGVSDADCDALKGPLAHPFSEGVPEHELVCLHEAGMTAD